MINIATLASYPFKINDHFQLSCHVVFIQLVPMLFMKCGYVSFLSENAAVGEVITREEENEPTFIEKDGLSSRQILNEHLFNCFKCITNQLLVEILLSKKIFVRK